MVDNPRKERWLDLLFCWHYIEHGINDRINTEIDKKYKTLHKS